MKSFLNKNKSADSVAEDQVAESTTSSGGIGLGFMVAALGILVGAICAAGIIYFQVVEGAQQAQQRIVAESYAGRYSSLLNQSIEKINVLKKRLASDPDIRVAVIQKNMDEQRLLVNSIQEKLPHLVRLELYSAGMAKMDGEPVAPVGHAALQMIVWGEQNKKVEAEIHKNVNRQLIYSVEPVLDKNQKPAGVLLMVFDLLALQQPLAILDGSMGKAQLIQEFPGLVAKPVFTVGSGQLASGVSEVNAQLNNSRWKLKFSPSEALFQNQGFSVFYLLMAGAVWVLTALAFLYASYSLLSKKLDANVQELFRFMDNTVKNVNNERYKFSLNMFESLSQGFTHLMTEYAKKQPSETKRSAATQTIAKKIEEAGRRDNQPPVQAYSGIEENYAEEINIPLEIFRAYDIRGVFEQSLTIEITEMIGKAIGSEVIDQGEQQVVVAADGRLSSPALKEALINGLTSTGCNVIDIGVTPTPVLYFALHHLGHRSGVMITGSHNPVEYNGLKIVIDGITIAEDRIQALYHRVLQDDHVTGNGRHESILVNDHYMDRVCNDVALIADPLKLVVDCGNGVAGSVAPGMLRALGCEVTELYCEVDGNFPNHAPDPSKSENLQDLISSVTSMNADLGLAFDGDGDRLIAVSGSGKIIQPDRLMMLFARDIVSRNPGADVVFDVKSSKHLAEVISEAGGRPVMWKSGHSLMKAKSDELGALLAGEFSGHLFFRERWYGFDDGIYTAARLLEVLSTEGLTLDELMSEFPWSPNTPELDIDIPDDKKFVFVERFREAANFEGGSQTDLDGVRVDFPDGWGLVRASNTMPKLTARFEADDEAALERIQDLFRQQLQAIDAEITIPF